MQTEKNVENGAAIRKLVLWVNFMSCESSYESGYWLIYM